MNVCRESPGVGLVNIVPNVEMVGLTAATFPPITNPFFLYVSLLRTAGSVGSATMVPAVSFPRIPGSFGNL